MWPLRGTQEGPETVPLQREEPRKGAVCTSRLQTREWVHDSRKHELRQQRVDRAPDAEQKEPTQNG